MSRKISCLTLVLAILLVAVFSTSYASTLTYQTSIGVGFTFNPMLSINLSSVDLIISNLAPGSSADSNIITVTVSTNTAYGYTLNATVGEATNYNTRNLIRSGVADNFASIDYGTSLASLTTDNTWGYSYKPSGNSASWTNYSGLPLYSDTNNVATLISTQDPADSDSVEFKIAAKASNTQPAGEYRNVINFMAVSNLLTYNYSITYDDPSGVAENMSDDMFGTTTDDFVYLDDQEPTRDNYYFTGWCDEYDDECESGTMYYPGDMIQFDVTEFSLSLTAIWEWYPDPDYCSENPDDPNCNEPDPCEIDPDDPNCNEPVDPCDIDPEDPDCSEPVDPCDEDPYNINCNEPEPY